MGVRVRRGVNVQEQAGTDATAAGSIRESKGREVTSDVRILEQLSQRSNCRALPAIRRDRHIVPLVGDEEEPKSCSGGDGVERHSPVGATLLDGRGNGVVGPRLMKVPIWLDPSQQLVDKNTRPATRISVDHSSTRAAQLSDQRVGRSDIGHRVVTSEGDPLSPPVATDEPDSFR
jgi:hypothetical protein